MKTFLVLLSMIASFVFWGSCDNNKLTDGGNRYGVIQVRVVSYATSEFIRDVQIEVRDSIERHRGSMILQDSNYHIQNLEPGPYRLIITHPDYYADTTRDVLVRIKNDTTPADVRLRLRHESLRLLAPGESRDDDTISSLNFSRSIRERSFSIFNNSTQQITWEITNNHSQWLQFSNTSGTLEARGRAGVRVLMLENGDDVAANMNNGVNISITSSLGSALDLIIYSGIARISFNQNLEIGGTARLSNWRTENEYFNLGDRVEISAIPAIGYEFVNWTGGGSDIVNPNSAITTVVLNTDRTLTAIFRPMPTLQLNHSPETGGTVRLSDWTESGYFNSGDRVEISAIPAIGYEFVNWTGGGSDIVNPNSAITTVVLNTDRTLTANFRRGPDTPKNVMAIEESSSRINLSWDLVSEATRYRIYRSPRVDGTFSLVTELPSFSEAYSDNGLSVNTTYFYQIVAVDAQGILSYPSQTVSARTMNRVKKDSLFVFESSTTWSIPASVNFPAIVSLGAIGPGGGGQGGHRVCTGTLFNACQVPAYDGTGGAGGGGAVSYVRFETVDSLTFTVEIGAPGRGGDGRTQLMNYFEPSGNNGTNAENTTIKWNSFSLQARGGNGGAGDRIGGNGGVATVPSVTGSLDDRSISGGRGNNGDRNNNTESRGGNAARLDRGTLEGLGGGQGAFKNAGQTSIQFAQVGGGGAANTGRNGRGSDGGRGEAQILISWYEDVPHNTN